MQTEYIDTETQQYPIYERNIRSEYPNVAFSVPFQPPEKYKVVFAAPQPAFDPLSETAVKVSPELTVLGHYEQRWQVVPLAPEQADKNLQSAKSAKNIEINNCRLLANTTTFAYQNKLFACDTLSRSDIDGVNGYVALFSALPQDFPGGWKAVDNSFMTINTVEEWKSFYTAMVAEGTANFIKAQNLKSLLANAQTLAEIQAIQW